MSPQWCTNGPWRFFFAFKNQGISRISRGKLTVEREATAPLNWTYLDAVIETKGQDKHLQVQHDLSTSSTLIELLQRKRRSRKACGFQLLNIAVPHWIEFLLNFQLLHSCLPCASHLNKSIIRLIEICNKIRCDLLLWQPININRLRLDSLGILSLERPMLAGHERSFQEKLSEIGISKTRCAEASWVSC